MLWEDVLLIWKFLLATVAFFVVFRFGTDHHRQWALIAQLAVAAVTELCAGVVLVLGNNNLYIYNIYLFLEFALLMTYAYHQWHQRYFRLAIFCAVPLFLLVAVPDVLRVWPKGEFASHGFMASSALLLGAFITLLFREALLLDGVLFKHADTWILLGMVFFFGGMLPILGLLNVLNERDPDLAWDLYSINDVLGTFCYGAIIVGTWRYRHTSRRVVP